MSLVNTETGEVITYADVRDSIAIARESGGKFFEQIVWQIEHQTWMLLGYSSWDEMRETEYAGMGVVVPSADRPEIAARLRRTGMTQQAIASTLGVNPATVSRDLASASSDDQPAVITNARGQQRPTSYQSTGRAADAPLVQPQGGGAPTEDASAEVDMGSAKPRPAAPQPSAVEQFLDADERLALTSWNREFMAAIAKAGHLFTFSVADVAAKADHDLLNELDRLVVDLGNYAARIKSQRPNHLTAIRGGAQ